MSVIVSIKLKN